MAGSLTDDTCIQSTNKILQYQNVKLCITTKSNNKSVEIHQYKIQDNKHDEHLEL